jgi:ribonuclease P/MRP protein subunit RPP1
MRFYDLHVHSAFSGGESSVQQLAETAKFLGYKGFCFSTYFEGPDHAKMLRVELEKVSKKVGIDIYLGFEAREPKEVEKLRQMRRKFDVFLVRGGDLEMNRLAVETPEVDILTHPESGRTDSGMNDVLFRMAAKNNVAIEINFREILNTSKSGRARLMRNVSENVRMARRVKAPLIVCSGALSHWEMKDPLVLTSFAHILGLEMKEAKAALSSVPEAIIRESEKRKSDRWVMPGVEEVG